MPHCTLFPHMPAPQGAIAHHWTPPQHQMYFGTTLLILVLEIRFNFQIDVFCAEKAIFKITFRVRQNLQQIWHSWHTRVTWKYLGIMGPEWLDKCNKTRVRFLSLARSKLRLCLANHRPDYWSNLSCDWPSIAWAYSKQETENGPRIAAWVGQRDFFHMIIIIPSSKMWALG